MYKERISSWSFWGALKKEYFIESGFKVYEQKNAINKSAEIGNYYIDASKYDELRRFNLNQGDFIVSCSGTIGRIYKIPKGFERGIINQALLKITTDEDKIHNDFFYQYFEWDAFQKKIIDSTQGGAMKNLVGMNIIRKTLFPLPPLPEQQHIAEILSTTDAHIERLDKIIEDYQLLKKGMMKKLLTEGIGHTEFKETEIGRIPKAWDVCNINQCTKKIIGGGTPSRSKSEYYSGNIPWITVKDLDGKFYKEDAMEYITEEAIKYSSANLVDSYSVIIATRMGLGRGFINTKPVAINQDLKALTFKSEIDTKYFLYWYLSKSEYIKMIGTGTTVKGIRLETLKDLLLPVPSKTEQKDIANIFGNIDKRIELIELEKQDLIQLKKALMEKLLTGKIRTKEFNSMEA